uniref:Uncharacterized protein n=1 Tax=Timema shepardi TaxID=629360 RepID=A0A7R9G3L3_TIMSH|nr:unnamed protein product [Timema shepardi]
MNISPMASLVLTDSSQLTSDSHHLAKLGHTRSVAPHLRRTKFDYETGPKGWKVHCADHMTPSIRKCWHHHR